MRSLTWDEVRGRRLRRSALVSPAPGTRLVEVVREVCGLQAQVLGAAELGIGVRVAGVSQRDVREVLWGRRELVKTWSLRGTLHLHPSDELALWMAAGRARPSWTEMAGPGGVALPVPAPDRVIEAIGMALDGRRLSRAELADSVAAALGEQVREPMMSGWGGVLQPAAYRGLLCFAPNRGSQVTFVRPDQWTGVRWADLDPADALAEVVRRQVASYGPTRPADLARWLGVDPPTARRTLESLGDELAPVDVQGQRALLLAADRDADWQPVTGTVRLLPQYDCYVIGFHPRDRLMSDAARERIRGFRRGRWEGVVALPVLLLDGRVGGLWERRARGRRLEVAVEPFEPLTARQRALVGEQAARIGEFYGMSAAVSYRTLG